MPIPFNSPVNTIQDYGEQVIAPVLLSYVEWMLELAQTRNFQKLYFLARDGHILREIAISLCEVRSIKIDCRYLYCSRYALRCASYGLLPQEEVLSLVGMTSVECSPFLVLQRCHLTKEQMQSVAAACGVTDLTQPLDKLGLRRFLSDLQGCPVFWDFLKQKSQKSYETAAAYLQQEGLLDGDVAIVDSGWSGSIQRSLGQLLRSMGFAGRLEGFYFGMYCPPKSPQDGTYHTFYFNHNGRLSDKAWFNNNLFECMLAAPHGMTVGYEQKDGHMVPVFQEKRELEELALVKAQGDGILRGVKRCLQEKGEPLSQKERMTRCRKQLRRCMAHPTTAEVKLLEAYQFCDDSTEGYFFPLAEIGTLRTLNTRLLPVRILRKLTHGHLFGRRHPFVWYYGAVAGAPAWLQPLYRWNEYIWECVRLSQL